MKTPFFTHFPTISNGVCASVTQKCHFPIRKVLRQWNAYKDTPINATILKNTQQHWKHMNQHKTTLDEQGDTWYDNEVGSKI